MRLGEALSQDEYREKVFLISIAGCLGLLCVSRRRWLIAGWASAKRLLKPSDSPDSPRRSKLDRGTHFRKHSWPVMLVEHPQASARLVRTNLGRPVPFSFQEPLM